MHKWSNPSISMTKNKCYSENPSIANLGTAWEMY